MLVDIGYEGVGRYMTGRYIWKVMKKYGKLKINVHIYSVSQKSGVLHSNLNFEKNIRQ